MCIRDSLHLVLRFGQNAGFVGVLQGGEFFRLWTPVTRRWGDREQHHGRDSPYIQDPHVSLSQDGIPAHPSYMIDADWQNRLAGRGAACAAVGYRRWPEP